MNVLKYTEERKIYQLQYETLNGAYLPVRIQISGADRWDGHCKESSCKSEKLNRLTTIDLLRFSIHDVVPQVVVNALSGLPIETADDMLLLIQLAFGLYVWDSPGMKDLLASKRNVMTNILFYQCFTQKHTLEVAQ